MKNLVRNQRVLSFGLVLAAMTLLAGCAAHHAYLVPTPTDNITNNGAVRAMAEGVTVTVIPNAWNGRPHNLYNHVTPLKVRIDNQSPYPLRVMFRDFKLETSGGKTLAALPPSEIHGTAYVGENREPFHAHVVPAAMQDPDHDNDIDHPQRIIVTPGFAWNSFYYAPYWDFGYAGLGPWPYAWSPDWGYYNTYYPYMQSIHLPTRSMLSKGIPEGVVAKGGYVEGFLYFKKVDPDVKTVDFVAHLQRAKTGERFGTIEVPFGVKSK